MDLPVPEGAEEFVPPPRETEADASGDTKTLDRRLKTRIYFALMENENSWGFPSSDLQPEETLREAAERVTKEKLGEDMEFVALSNCPIAVDLKVDKNDTYYGTKTFYMKIQYTKGTPQRLKGAMDYGWLDRTELSEKAMMTGGESARKFFHYML
jgi:large subunit ribosomal protein L46